MPTFRKTATIEATQWFKPGDHPAVIMKSDRHRYADNEVPWCPTLEGGHVVTPGDWIATGVQGEHWPIKDEVFRATYQAVEDGDQTPSSATGWEAGAEAMQVAASNEAHYCWASGIPLAEVHQRISALPLPPPPSREG